MPEQKKEQQPGGWGGGRDLDHFSEMQRERHLRWRPLHPDKAGMLRVST